MLTAVQKTHKHFIVIKEGKRREEYFADLALKKGRTVFICIIKKNGVRL
jgi:hypothetical protein